VARARQRISASQQEILDRLVETARLRLHYDEAYRAGILEAANDGLSNGEIARALGLSNQTIQKIVAKYGANNP
jgi:DNA-binding NarL/FixJ family response regulator